MKIGIVAFLVFDFPGVDAHSRRIEMFARGLSERGHEVTIIVPIQLRAGVRQKTVDGIHVVWCYSPESWPIPTRKQLLGRWQTFKWLHSVLRQNAFDWILAYNVSMSGVPIALLTKRFGKRFGTIRGEEVYHTGNPSLYIRLNLALFRLADFLLPKLSSLNIVDTPYLEQRAKRYAPKIPTIRIPALINRDKFRPDPREAKAFRESWNLGDSIVIGHTGTYAVTHGNATLMRAGQMLMERGFDVKLLLPGRTLDTFDCDDIPALTRELGLEGRVITPGYLGTKDLIAALTACDILAIPRLHHIANIASSPTKLPEYLSIGKPVVVTNIGDMPLNIRNGENGLVVEPNNAAELADALQKLIEDEQLRQRFAQAALETVDQLFDYRKAAERLEDALLKASQS